MAIDPRATTDPAFIDDSLTISSSVIGFSDFTNLTTRDDDLKVSGYRITVDGDVRYTIDGSDPTVSTGHLWVADATHDFHVGLVEQIKWIRDGATDATLTISPLIMSVQRQVYGDDLLDLGDIGSEEINGSLVEKATDSNYGVVQTGAVVDGSGNVPTGDDVFGFVNAGGLRERLAKVSTIEIGSADNYTCASGLDFGLGGFTFVWDSFKTDFTPSATSDVFRTNSTGNNRFRLSILTNGAINLEFFDDVGSPYNQSITLSPAIPDNSKGTFAITTDRTTLTAKFVGFDPSGNFIESEGSVDISSASTINIGDGNTNPATFYADTDTEGEFSKPYVYNRGLTATELDDRLYRGVVPDAVSDILSIQDPIQRGMLLSVTAKHLYPSSPDFAITPFSATPREETLVYENIDCTSDVYLGGAQDVLPDNAVVTGVAVVNKSEISAANGIVLQLSNGTAVTALNTLVNLPASGATFGRASSLQIFQSTQTTGTLGYRRLRIPACTSGGEDLTFIITYKIFNY